MQTNWIMLSASWPWWPFTEHCSTNSTFYASAHRIASRKECTRSHNTSLNKFQRIKILQRMFSGHNGTKLEINNRSLENPQSWLHHCLAAWPGISSEVSTIVGPSSQGCYICASAHGAQGQSAFLIWPALSYHLGEWSGFLQMVQLCGAWEGLPGHTSSSR